MKTIFSKILTKARDKESLLKCVLGSKMSFMLQGSLELIFLCRNKLVGNMDKGNCIKNSRENIYVHTGE